MSQDHRRTARDLTRVVGEIEQRLPPKRRRREPSTPRVTLDTKPTPERIAKIADGIIEQTTGSKAYRIRTPIDNPNSLPRLTEDEICVARRYQSDRMVADAGPRQAITPRYNGMPSVAYGPRTGGVVDHAREAFNVMEISAHSLDSRHKEVLDELLVGTDDRISTLEDVGRKFSPTPYKGAEENRAVGMGLFKASLWTMGQFYKKHDMLKRLRRTNKKA
jgi:hypothetical protein